MTPEYCVTVPVYNEELRIEAGIERLWTFARDHRLPMRIDIADNGSTDATKRLATDLATRLSHVTVTHVSSKGVGLALQESWRNAPEVYVGYMDVDLSTDLGAFLTVVEAFARDPSIDVINGSRLLPESKVIGRTLRREVSSRGFNYLLKTLLNVGFTDGMCGFKFLKNESFRKLTADGLRRPDWFFNTELLVRAEWLRLRLTEIAVTWSDDPAGSNVRIIDLARSYLRSILELRRERDARSKPGL